MLMIIANTYTNKYGSNLAIFGITDHTNAALRIMSDYNKKVNEELIPTYKKLCLEENDWEAENFVRKNYPEQECNCWGMSSPDKDNFFRFDLDHFDEYLKEYKNEEVLNLGGRIE